MPQIIFKGVSPQQVKAISTEMVNELARLCQCEIDNFTLEIPSSTFVFAGEEVTPFPFIEVKWFERGQEIRDQFTQIITKYIHSLQIPEVEVAYTVFSESAYYYNGEHFA